MKKFILSLMTFIVLASMTCCSTKLDNPKSVSSNADTTYFKETKLETKTYKVGDVEFKMIAVEGGIFTMGFTPEQYGLAKNVIKVDEMPFHIVTLSDFAIGETEVTQALWEAVMGSNDSHFHIIFPNETNRPAECICWVTIQEFLDKLNAMTNEHFCLPTEAEWEYAARGGKFSKGYKFSGSNNVEDVAWCEFNGDCQTHPVKTKLPNELGIYDMSGNVDEWCQDLYDKYSCVPQFNPTVLVKSDNSKWWEDRVIRGGTWMYPTDSHVCCYCAHRDYYETEQSWYDQGLRLAIAPNRSNNPAMPSFAWLKWAL